MSVKIGVLALQGAYALHVDVLRSLGAEATLVRTAEQLADVDALVLPGGESTTMSMLLASSGLTDPLADRLEAGLPCFGTCAGMILLATEVLDGRPDQHNFGVLDLTVRRNGYGRQIDSFEGDLTLEGGLAAAGLDDPYHAVFIRAPLVERTGPTVEVLASVDGRAALVRSTERPIWAAAFHPELSDDPRIHARFLEEI